MSDETKFQLLLWFDNRSIGICIYMDALPTLFLRDIVDIHIRSAIAEKPDNPGIFLQKEIVFLIQYQNQNWIVFSYFHITIILLVRKVIFIC